MPVTIPEQTTQRSGYFVSSFIFEKKKDVLWMLVVFMKCWHFAQAQIVI